MVEDTKQQLIWATAIVLALLLVGLVVNSLVGSAIEANKVQQLACTQAHGSWEFVSHSENMHCVVPR